MVTLRSRREIDRMRGAGSIVVEALAEAARMLKPGVSTYEIDRTIEKAIEKRREARFPTAAAFRAALAQIAEQGRLLYGAGGFGS